MRAAHDALALARTIGAPTKRQRAALAVVRQVIGDAREQLESMRRLSVGLPVRVVEELVTGERVEHVVHPSARDVREAAAYLIERRWGSVVETEPLDPDSVPTAAQLPDGLRVRLRTLAREITFEKGHSPRDADADGLVPLDHVAVWPERGTAPPPAEGVPARRGAWGGGGAPQGGPTRCDVGPKLETRVLLLPDPLEVEKTPGVSRMPSPCGTCGHRHAAVDAECDVWMEGFGRSCRCPVYVDLDEGLVEESVVLSPEAVKLAEVFIEASAGAWSECVCGHARVAHFLTPASRACTVCGCRVFRGAALEEGASGAPPTASSASSPEPSRDRSLGSERLRAHFEKQRAKGLAGGEVKG